MIAGYWTAMADVLMYSKWWVSSCFTLNAQEAQGKEFISRLDSLNFFCKGFNLCCFKFLCWGSGSVIAKIEDLFICSCRFCEQTQRQWVPSFWHMMQKLDEQLRLFHPIFRTNPMSVRNLYFWLSFRTMPSLENTDKVSYYVNYEIASVFRDEMLLKCVKR